MLVVDPPFRLPPYLSPLSPPCFLLPFIVVDVLFYRPPLDFLSLHAIIALSPSFRQPTPHFIDIPLISLVLNITVAPTLFLSPFRILV